MKRTFTASVWQEGDLSVAQRLDVDVASQGQTEAEALELDFEPPTPTLAPQVRSVEVEGGTTTQAHRPC